MGRRRPFRRSRQRIEAASLRALGAVARMLPFERAGDLGAAIGALAFRVLGRRRRIAIENLTTALGPAPGGLPAETMARRVFEQLGRSFLEFLAIPAHRREDLRARIEFVGWEPLQEWGRSGRGAVVVTGHFGNWELLGMFGGMELAPVKYLLPRQTNPGSDDYLNEVRRRAGVEPLVIGYGMRAGLRALKEGAFLGMLPDQDARGTGIHVPFFGRPASTHTGPARLAIAANAPIAVAVMERSGRGRFRARIDRVLFPDPSAGQEAEVRRLTTEMTQVLEAAIRGRPDHWYWIHRRWKTPPRDTIPVPVRPAVRT